LFQLNFQPPTSNRPSPHNVAEQQPQVRRGSTCPNRGDDRRRRREKGERLRLRQRRPNSWQSWRQQRSAREWQRRSGSWKRRESRRRSRAAEVAVQQGAVGQETGRWTWTGQQKKKK